MRVNLTLSTWSALILIGSLLGSGITHAAPTKQSIEQSIERAMDVFQVPGMAVSVVYDNKVFYSEGHGIVEIGFDSPVSELTLFQIASVSKAFTTAALALLVDEGKLEWDAPVIDYLPEFRLYDPWVTREFTVRDLITHRSGLPLGAGDLLLFPEGNTSRDEVIRAMRYLKPSTSFRSEYAYDNLLFIIAGEVVARVSGLSFEDFLEQELLAPLGMQDCAASLGRAAAGASKAIPHILVDDEFEITRSHITDTSSAAGGINCSAASMAHWMQFVLNEGKTETGDQLLSAGQFEQWVKPVTLLDPSSYMVEHAGSHLAAYALGWGVSTFYGQPMLSHSGGLWGMTSFIAVLPESGLAVFASNNQMTAAPRAIVFDVLDQFLEGSSPDAGKDWITILNDLYQARLTEGAETVALADESRAATSTPSLPLEAYAGTYTDDWYGAIEISLDEDGSLWFQSGRSEHLAGPMEHFQFDTFIARWNDRKLNADAYVMFTLSPEGEVDRIRMKAVSPTTDFSFDFHDLDLKRVPDDNQD